MIEHHSETMKILMIAPEPVLEPRGTPISIYQRLKALCELGHQVDLVTYHLGEDMHLPGVTIHRIPSVPFIKRIKIGPSFAKLVLDLFVFFKAFFLMMAREYEVIHSHEEASFCGLVLSRLFGTYHIYDMHSSLPNQLLNFHFWGNKYFVSIFQYLENLVINHCDAVITIDDELFALVQALNPKLSRIKIDNLALWHGFNQNHQIELSHLKESLQISGRVPIVYTGSFEQYQGLEMLLESAEILRRDKPDIVFILVGGHSFQIEKLQKLAAQKNLGQYFRFAGIVPPDEVILYLMLAEILISPRLNGTSVPLKIYSYLQSGNPIVATNLPAHTQILNSDMALLVEPTKDALAEGIRKLLDDPQAGKTLGRNARRFVEGRFSWDLYLSKVDTIYRELDLKRSTKSLPSKI
jgi:glycosyltransferase involved in cell wall biosynthesis